jgi:hypothetical protein
VDTDREDVLKQAPQKTRLNARSRIQIEGSVVIIYTLSAGQVWTYRKTRGQEKTRELNLAIGDSPIIVLTSTGHR